MEHFPPLARRLLLTGAVASIASPALAQRAYAPARPYPQVTVRQQQPQPQSIQLETGEIGGTFAKIGSDISVVSAEGGVEVKANISRGSVANIRALLETRGVDLALASTDSLAYVARDPLLAARLSRIRYIAKLYDSEFHLLARDPAIRAISDLAGKRICTDVEGSGTSVTANIVLDLLGIQADIVTDNPGRGLVRLRRGEIDALAYVIGKPGVMFRAQPMDGLHLVEIPLTDAIAARYMPATFVHEDYPDLVPDGREVGSIAVGAVLACYGWPEGTDRYRNLERFVRVFVSKLDEMQEPPFHTKWREVNLAAQVPSWQRFGPVEGAILAAQKTKDAAFDAFLASLGQSNAGPAKRDEMRARFRELQAR